MKNKELIIWVLILCYLKFSNPFVHSINLCFFDWIGVKFCPGHGLGRSIHYILSGDIMSSFDYHILGIPVIIAICYRIIQILQHENTRKRRHSYYS